VLLAPAMNTLMWRHPLTARHLRSLVADAPDGLDEDGLVAWINARPGRLRIVPPICKTLACGDVGVGAMAEVADIVAAVQATLAATTAREVEGERGSSIP
jgi:phosphopantothenoylcysteine decarboxylase